MSDSNSGVIPIAPLPDAEKEPSMWTVEFTLKPDMLDAFALGLSEKELGGKLKRRKGLLVFRNVTRLAVAQSTVAISLDNPPTESRIFNVSDFFQVRVRGQ